MQTKEIISEVYKYVLPIIEENNFELVDVEFVKEGANYYLRLYVDKEGGISIQECAQISKYLDEKLSDDFIEKAYILEVSSPGIDRVLKTDKEYIKYKDKIVDVKLYKAIDKIKEFRGNLIGRIDDKIIIEVDDNKMEFETKDVATCRLAVIF